MNAVVQRAGAAARAALRRHFVDLPAADQYLRFGAMPSAEAISDYVQRIDFETDAVFVIHDDDLAVVGVAHVAFRGASAELGLSVLPACRGQGLGSALFERAATHIRNRSVTAVHMQCLAQNTAILRIARAFGMEITSDGPEAGARLELPPASPSSIAAEFAADSVAQFDHVLKLHNAALRSLERALQAAAPDAEASCAGQSKPLICRRSIPAGASAVSSVRRSSTSRALTKCARSI